MNTTLAIAANLTWQPAMPTFHVFAIMAMLGLMATAAYARTFRVASLRSSCLWLMRLIAITVLGVMLLGPSRSAPTSVASGRSTVTLLLDTSGSMLTEDSGGAARLSYVIERWLNPRMLIAISRRFNLRLVAFDEAPRPLELSSLTQPPDQLVSGQSTHYSESLQATLQAVEPGDVLVVMGDGHETDAGTAQAAISLAKARGVTMYTVAVGQADAPRDVAVSAAPRQEYLLAGEEGQLVVTLYQAGVDDGQALMRLQGEGLDEHRVLRFEGRSSVTTELPIRRAEPGTYEYTVSVDPVEGEAVTTNNRQAVYVEVIAQRVRVLLLEGEPFWDTRFLAQALRNDIHIELDVLTKVTEQKGPESIVTRGKDREVKAPVSAEDWAAYDVVVLGRAVEKLLTPESLARLADHVASGAGHLIFARGRPYDPDTPGGRDAQPLLAGMEPVTWGTGVEPLSERHRLALTLEGRAHPSFAFPGVPGGAGHALRSLPAPASLLRVGSVKPAATVLAILASSDREPPSSGDPPAVAMMTYGGGRVFAVLGEGLWRWRLLPPSLGEFRGAFDALWSDTVRWLTMGGDFQPGHEVALDLARSSLRLGDPMNIDVSLKHIPLAGFSPALLLIDPAGISHPVTLQPIPGQNARLTSRFTPQQAGSWSAVLNASPLNPAQLTRRFSVYHIDVERLRSGARPGFLRALAEQTGGEFFTADRPVDLAERIERQRRADTAPPRAEFIWDNAWVMAALLIWIGIEWIARRRSGWL